MKEPLILLFTRDGDYAQSVCKAVSETGATALIAQTSAPDCKSFGNAGRELDFGLMDFDDVGAAGHFSARSTIERLPKCCDDFGEGRACKLSCPCEWHPNVS
jgi:hypothetical protein